MFSEGGKFQEACIVCYLCAYVVLVGFEAARYMGILSYGKTRFVMANNKQPFQ